MNGAPTFVPPCVQNGASGGGDSKADVPRRSRSNRRPRVSDRVRSRPFLPLSGCEERGMRDSVQRFRYYPGIMDQRVGLACRSECEFDRLGASSDHHFLLMDAY